MNDQRNLIIAIVISVAIMFGFQFFFEAPRQEAAQRQQQLLAQQAESAKSAEQTATAPTAPAGATAGGALLPQTPGVAAPAAPRSE
ncbi:MAG: membrane protein insertase YidC, partial [Alphaproteobacteria bacterium]